MASCHRDDGPAPICPRAGPSAHVRSRKDDAVRAPIQRATSAEVVVVVVTAPRTAGGQVETGVFGANMAVSPVNDGPVTLLPDTTV